MLTEFSQSLLHWYDLNARDLPWRNHPDPYAVWVSEIMLQQTRVESVIPYFERWMRLFPDVRSLAAADQQSVLKAWEGLGYYSRARNLHKAAQVIVHDYDGQMPQSVQALTSLPGIGRYTAAAIGSMAFGLDAAALDGNIRRVLARVFDLEIPARSLQGEKLLWQWAEENVPPGRAGDYNQAMMDLGAGVCLPRNPRCLICPVQSVCRAFALEIQDHRPVMPIKEQTPHYTVTAAVIFEGVKVLIAQRPAFGLLGGLWEFPGGKVEEGETLEQGLQREIEEELDCKIEVGKALGVYRHTFTHFRITLHAFRCEITAGQPQAMEAKQIAWVAPENLAEYPMGKVDRQISRKLVMGASESV